MKITYAYKFSLTIHRDLYCTKLHALNLQNPFTQSVLHGVIRAKLDHMSTQEIFVQYSNDHFTPPNTPLFDVYLSQLSLLIVVYQTYETKVFVVYQGCPNTTCPISLRRQATDDEPDGQLPDGLVPTAAAKDPKFSLQCQLHSQVNIYGVKAFLSSSLSENNRISDYILAKTLR